MNWLSALPHQIPFRAASAVRSRDEKSIEGTFLWTANEFLPPEIMLVEGMAQFAGGLVFEGQGFLTGIDRCQVTREVTAGDRVFVSVRLEAEFNGTFRFDGVATCDGVEIGRGRFYLAGPSADEKA